MLLTPDATLTCHPATLLTAILILFAALFKPQPALARHL
jgi:hypothetical protein